MTLTTERQQFEQWWETAMHNGYPPRFGWEHWRDGEGYRDDDGEFQGLWLAWLASRKLANREVQLAEWSGWACQFPGHMPRLYGEKAIAEINCDYDGGARLLFLSSAPPAAANAQAAGYFVRHRSVWDNPSLWSMWTECSAEDYAEYCKQIATGEANGGWFFEARILYDAPAPAVPGEMRNAYRAEGLAEVLKDASEYAPLTAKEWETLVNNWHQTFVGLSGDANACRAAMLAAAPAVNSAQDFEAWFVEKYKQPERLVKNEDGTYKFASVQMAFSAWVDVRAAMLAQPVSQGYKFNYPEIPDCWVACSERLPDETQPVIVVSDGGVVQRTVYQFCDGVWSDWYDQHDHLNADVFTHWMPLPAAPEGGNDHDTRR